VAKKTARTVQAKRDMLAARQRRTNLLRPPWVGREEHSGQSRQPQKVFGSNPGVCVGERGGFVKKGTRKSGVRGLCQFGRCLLDQGDWETIYTWFSLSTQKKKGGKGEKTPAHLSQIKHRHKGNLRKRSC